MRYIKKQSEPSPLSSFKQGGPDWVPSWASFDGNSSLKREVKDALLTEQGYVCCYCESRIVAEGSHIEHLFPRDKDKEAKLHLDWQNLVASCNSPREPREKTYCGHAKDNWYDGAKFVSPLQSDCQDRFRFRLTGKIEPADSKDDASVETIRRLRLNHKRLVALRHDVIRAVLPEDEESSEDVKLLIKALSVPDANGVIVPFSSALIDTLKQFVKT